MDETAVISNRSTRVLLVEDNPGDAFYIQTLLSESGVDLLELTQVEDLNAAFRCSDNQCFDIALLDLSLPDSHGIATLLAMREKSPSLPIVVLTGLDDEGLAIQALRAQAQDYLVKDQVNGPLLKRTIHHAIERAQLLEKLCQREAQLRGLNQTLQCRVEVCTVEMGQMNHQLQVLQALSATDSLTQIANRRYFEEFFEQAWRRALRNAQPISVILIDIDQFKLFNDSYGHQRGDDCLRQVAQTLQGTVKRSRDLVARYGGEEFVVILPNTSKLGAIKVAESIGSGVLALGIAHSASTVSNKVTVSLGVSSTRPKPGAYSSDLIAEADQALYLAKHEGRNRMAYFHPASSVTQFSDAPPSPSYGRGKVHPFHV